VAASKATAVRQMNLRMMFSYLGKPPKSSG
jgi:hypothetical protein